MQGSWNATSRSRSHPGHWVRTRGLGSSTPNGDIVVLNHRSTMRCTGKAHHRAEIGGQPPPLTRQADADADEAEAVEEDVRPRLRSGSRPVNARQSTSK